MRRVKRSRKTASIVKLAELAVAAPQVVAIRTARMLAAGANPGAKDRAEFSQMSLEKVEAFSESLLAIGAQMMRTQQEYARTMALQMWRLSTTPWWLAGSRLRLQAMKPLPLIAGLIPGPSHAQRTRAAEKLVEAAVAPVHKRATSNARRLTRLKKRARR